jgi:hypothetical protein
MPVDDPIVAFVLLLLHVPPLVRSLSVVVEPGQTLSVPSMPDGKGFTVTTAALVLTQPVGKV